MIYLIGSRSQSICKIGYTAGSAEARRRSLQTGSMFTLAVLAQKEGDKKEEGYLHRKFDHLRLSGEWFQLTPELAAEFGIDLDAPLKLWAVYIKFKKQEMAVTTVTTSMTTEFAATAPEAIEMTRERLSGHGRFVEGVASRITDSDILKAYATMPDEYKK